MVAFATADRGVGVSNAFESTAVAGYCPGTAVAGAGAGRPDALWATAGMLAGAAAFVRLYPRLKPLLDAGDLGRVRLGA